MTYETIRHGCQQFGQQDANPLQQRARTGDTWHLEEVFFTSTGTLHSRLRAAWADHRHTRQFGGGYTHVGRVERSASTGGSTPARSMHTSADPPTRTDEVPGYIRGPRPPLPW